MTRYMINGKILIYDKRHMRKAEVCKNRHNASYGREENLKLQKNLVLHFCFVFS